ncbi:MAG: family 16 glycosylhydrolase [Bacillota bacterium]
MKKSFILVVFLIGILLIVGCGSDNSTEDAVEYDLTVNITDSSGTAIEGAEVTVDEKADTTNTDGVTSISLKDGDYTVDINASGYEDVSKEVMINGEEEIVDFSLKATDTSDNWEPGSDWELSWSDEFDENKINSDYWTRQELPAGTFNNEWQEYTDSSENAYVEMDEDNEDGQMVIEAKYNEQGLEMGNFTSARMITNEKVEYKYGKIAARIKVPEGQGIWPAFWMLGTNIDETGGDTPWPQSGEIDIMEKQGGSDTKEKTVYGTAHYADENNDHKYEGGEKTIEEYLSADYHVYEIEWDEDSIVWKLDGEEYYSLDISSSEFDEFRKEFYILLNVAVGGTFSGDPDSTTDFPQKMYIDWVRVYKK